MRRTTQPINQPLLPPPTFPRPPTEAQRKFKHSRVVGFLVEPYSIKHSYEGTWPSDPEAVSDAYIKRYMCIVLYVTYI